MVGMDLENILSNYSYIFILVLIRYLGLFLFAPVLGSNVIPIRVKLGLVFFLAVMTVPLFYSSGMSLPSQEVIILRDVLLELGIGFTMGFIANLSFAAIQLAGRFIDLRMGFAIVNVVDPIHGETMPMMAQYKNILAILLFLAMNGHQLLIKTLYQSFEVIPLASGFLSNKGFQFIFRQTGDLFLLAFKIALPVIGTILVADIIFGFLARTIPQINIFIVGLPVKIMLGFVILMLSLHFVIYCFQDLFEKAFRDLINMLKFFV
jgi:flagellar biosynthetic protein FliR